MDSIFHEKQEGSLCAQHCLNSLLQGPYFTAVELSLLAQKLDEEERQRMAECGEESEEYQKFLQQPSGNMDDSGYFSVQVISSALQVWGLELVPYASSDVRINMDNPAQMNAFICNYRDHWLTVRKIGTQWFNLNSLLSRPELISDTYLALFLAQLQNDGYSIFVVLGDLPECSADEILRQHPVGLYSSNTNTAAARPILQTAISNESDPDIQAALQLSLRENHKRQQHRQDAASNEEKELQEALRLSMQGFDTSSSNSSPEENDDEESLLRKAINMSLQC